ncbi:UNVERIFIED_CONTAM: hypothetical protein K2H54_065880 [Gekko kuhli]
MQVYGALSDHLPKSGAGADTGIPTGAVMDRRESFWVPRQFQPSESEEGDSTPSPEEDIDQEHQHLVPIQVSLHQATLCCPMGFQGGGTQASNLEEGDGELLLGLPTAAPKLLSGAEEGLQNQEELTAEAAAERPGPLELSRTCPMDVQSGTEQVPNAEGEGKGPVPTCGGGQTRGGQGGGKGAVRQLKALQPQAPRRSCPTGNQHKRHPVPRNSRLAPWMWTTGQGEPPGGGGHRSYPTPEGLPTPRPEELSSITGQDLIDKVPLESGLGYISSSPVELQYCVSLMPLLLPSQNLE